MKKGKLCLALGVSIALVSSGMVGSSVSAQEVDYYTENAEEIQMMKEAGVTDEQIEMAKENVEAEKAFLEENADKIAEEDISYLEELAGSDLELAKEEFAKIDDPEYGFVDPDDDGKVEQLAASKKLGTKGDVLVGYDIESGSSSIGIGHTAIVHTDNTWLVESFAKKFAPGKNKKDGVRRYTNNWKPRKKVYGLWVKGASNAQYKAAATYSLMQIGKPYNWSFFNKFTTKSFYCSQLAWRAWYDQGYNIDAITWDKVVTPMELVNSSKTKIFHHRKG